jgi:hypothetical protein
MNKIYLIDLTNDEIKNIVEHPEIVFRILSLPP